MNRVTWWMALLLAGASLSFSGCATVRTIDELSAMQISALQESDQRLDVYDGQLQKLDDAYAKGKIHRAAYEKQTKSLVALIRDESEFQNAILIKDPKIKVMAQNLLDNIQKALEMTPIVIEDAGLVFLKALAGSGATIK
ncbi:MAG: hypothetical protein LV481_15205 [Methylacidiphilales bacterium]|nr:hypothetical protein [Candidatus Methylacidiphilales bacterium]